jgi:small subunit ribosomal protein S20
MKTDIKKTSKKFLASVQKKDVAQAQSNLNLMYKKLDKAIKRNLIHRNTAARRKSRFSRLVAGISSPKA